MNTPFITLALAAAMLLPACDDAAPRHERVTMPEAPYKAGEAALADIRGVYEAANRREVFNLSAKHLQPFADYLRTGVPTTELLYDACEYNCPALVEELIARGVDVNSTRLHWDIFESDGERESTRHSTRAAIMDAALPSFYKGGATAEKAIRIIDLLLAAGADPKLGESPLPSIVQVEHDYEHFEEVFLHLLDCGYTLDEERRTPTLTEKQQELARTWGITIDKARITDAQRENVLYWLRFRRELGYPWSRVEARLGLTPDSPARADNNTIDEPSPEDFMLEEGERPVAYSDEGDFCYVPLPEAKKVRLRDALARCATLRLELETDDGDKAATLPRSDAPVRALLEALARTDAWLDTRQNRGWDIDPSCWGTLSLLDDGGKVLWQGSATDICRRNPESGEIVSLLDALEPLLPFEL